MDSEGETFKLYHKNVQCFTYQIENGATFRAILISDLHVARFHSKHESISQIVAHLRTIIDRNQANLIFICGDIIHFKLFVGYKDWIEVYSALEELGVEIHVIPGNHDRFRNKKVMSKFHGRNVHLHLEDLIKIIPPNGRTVVLGHDVRNDKKVHGSYHVRIWFRSLREQFSNYIDQDSFLILGHLHEEQESKDGLTKSLMPYSYDLRVFYYGFLFLNENQEIDSLFEYQEGNWHSMII
ncbi:hypothetical protein TRFO_06131 [Tritrichomonas foetus]|uniref:Calcineurin-like phosphoesterase domain-containing protein n=1 Tax=Tritrichomonas foetus TaxID=1144522 RepID=A0A1J4K0F6_9EUKA|nr:hypothetical protein TRFO_06131 [Tritrichomonas foetus]|eukprot:OHT04715.1 hypothetical protein TRFO_06131 [Tritrichomonas foetus]